MKPSSPPDFVPATDRAPKLAARSIRPADRGELTTPSYNDRFQYRIGSGLSPQFISGVMQQTDYGYMDRWADLLDEVRQGDPHLHGELFKREHQVSSAPIELVAPPKSGRKGEKAIAYCQDIIDSLEVPAASLALDFRGVLTSLLGANWHGRAACEVMWARDGRALRPSQITWIHARRLSYSGHNWKLYLWDATAGDTRFNLFPGTAFDDATVFPPGKLLVHTPRLFGTYPTREGLGRALIWYAAFKRWSVRDWLAFAEWAGRGMRIGKYATGNDPKNPARASPQDIAALDEALLAMSSTVATSIPDTSDLTVLASPNNNEVHERLTLLCNGEISKATLGGTLTTDPGEKGARSLGDIHDSVRRMIASADAAPLANTIRRDLFMPACREKFGDADLAPRMLLITEPKEAQDSLVDRVAKLAKSGVRIPSGWVRESQGIPDPNGDEECIGGPAPEGEDTPANDPNPDGAQPTDGTED